MLDIFRKAAKSKFALIPVGLLIISFSVWGTQGIFRGRTPTAVAKVGSQEIEGAVFAREFSQAVRRIQQQSPGLTEAQARAFGFDRQVLTNMIGELALAIEARKLRLGIADEIVAENLRNEPAFHNTAGVFDRMIYEAILRQNDLTPEQFEASVRGDLMRAQLLSTAAPIAVAPKGLAGVLYAFDHEQRRVTLVTVPASAAGEIGAPDEAALKAFHEQNARRFSRPERRTISYVRIAPHDFIDEVNVPDTAIAESYEADKERYTTPERRALDQLLFPTREAADQAAAEIAKGASFEAAAERAKAQGIELIDLGSVPKSEIIDPAIAEAAFALPAPGTVSPVIEGEFGFALVRIRKIEPAITRPLDEVRGEIKERLALDDATELSFQTLDDFEDRRLEGQSLEDAAKASGLEVTTLPAIDAQGRTSEGTAPEALPTDRAFIELAFDAIEGEESDPLALGDGSSVILRVDAIEPGGLKPLEEVRDEVAEAWRAAERERRLGALVDTLVAEANAGTQLEAIASRFGRTATARREPVERTTNDATVPAGLARAIFSGREGTVVSGPAAAADSFALARIDAIIRPDLAAATAEIEADADRITQTMRAELLDRYVAALHDKAGVEIYEDRLAQVFGPAETP